MRVTDLDTPAVVIDARIAEANLKRAQDYADAHALKLRPHIKTHKLPHFAKRQMELGAIGITCQKLGEAEVMTDAGLADIFVPYNIIGREKLERLAVLHRRVRISVSADSEYTVAGYAAAFADGGHPLPVLIECDTGAHRCGVQSPREAQTLAHQIARTPGLRFEGLMTYPPRGRLDETDAWLAEAIALIRGDGIDVPVVSNGGTPDFYRSAEVKTATEHRPGTYIYGDRMQIGFGAATLADCALSVLATVVSRPTKDRAILDAGSKALAADLSLAPGHGAILEYPQAIVTGLSEEHGSVDLSASPTAPGIGETVRVIPNHACVVTNLFDFVHIAEGDTIVARLPVAGRGKVS
jgi:D-serine deaminase-like pyridoxal phosphate-dependent protein